MKLSIFFVVTLMFLMSANDYVLAGHYCIEPYESNGMTNCFPFITNGSSIVATACISPTENDYVTEDITITTVDGWSLVQTELWYGFNVKNSPLDANKLPKYTSYKNICSPAVEGGTSCVIPISFIGLFDNEALAESYKLPCNRKIYTAIHASILNQQNNELVEVWSDGTPFIQPTEEIPTPPTYSILQIRCGEHCL